MVIAQILILPTYYLFKTDLLKAKLNQYASLVLMALTSAGANITSNLAYAENVSITSTILSLPFSMIIAIILSVFYPKLLEKHTAKIYTIRVTTAAVMFWAALQLSK